MLSRKEVALNRRQFLQFLLGAPAIAALPAPVLALAEQEIAPLADAVEAWTPSKFMFSIFVERTVGVRVPIWERYAFQVSKEMAQAMIGSRVNNDACSACLQRVLRTIGQDNAEMYGAQLEELPYSPPQFSVDWSASPANAARMYRNLLTYSTTVPEWHDGVTMFNEDKP